MRTKVNIAHRLINMLKIEGLLALTTVDDKVVLLALEAFSHWTHWFIKQVVVESTASVRTFAVFEDHSAVGALIRLAEAKAFAFERLSASRAGHVSSPQFAGRAANTISNI